MKPKFFLELRAEECSRSSSRSNKAHAFRGTLQRRALRTLLKSAAATLRCALGLAWIGVLDLNARAQSVDTIANSSLLEPHSIAFSSDTTFYISDSAAHRVVRFDSENGQITTLAGASGQPGSADGPGFVARLNSPKGLALAPTRNGLLVADSANQTLRLITHLTGSVAVVTNFAGAPGVVGPAAPVGQPIPLASALFNAPIGLALDTSGRIYVADSKNNAIRKIEKSGVDDIITTISTDFLEPSAMAYDDTHNRLFVADTRNHVIKFINLSDNTVITNFAGSFKIAGTTDALFAKDALFNQPSGLVWLGDSIGLLVSDTGNHTVRRIFRDPILDDPVLTEFFGNLQDWEQYSVDTYAGVPRQPGLVDGPLKTAKFNSPVGMARDSEGALLVADLGNRAIRRIQTTPKLPKITNPLVGYVRFLIDQNTGQLVVRLSAFTNAVFQNEVTIAVSAEVNTESFYTFGPTPKLFETDTIPTPNSLNSLSAPLFVDGSAPDEVKPSIISPNPDVTLKVLSTADNRRPSDVVQARVQFKAATPNILGDNPALFTVSCATTNAAIWYTLDGSVPTNQPPSLPAPLLDPTSLSAPLTIITNGAFVFRARSFRQNFKPSEVATKSFSPTQFEANQITFGFDRGEASSQFVAAPGQKFYAPVTLTVLPATKIYTMQFGVTVTNLSSSPVVSPGGVGFQSMLKELIPTAPPLYRTIPAAIFNSLFASNSVINPPPAELLFQFTNSFSVFTSLPFTNNNINLLGVGWLESYGKTNLYNTVQQDLISYSIAHDAVFRSPGRKVVVGAYSFDVPGAARQGDSYLIEIGRPTATSDAIGGSGGEVFIESVNASTNVTISERRYIAGDVVPFHWFNAGDFGENEKFENDPTYLSLRNNDVEQVFQSAIYQYGLPIDGSDFLDAMDSCCGLVGNADAEGNYPRGAAASINETNGLFSGTDSLIDSIGFGDDPSLPGYQRINVADVYVTFRRSIDPSLKWFQRFWHNGNIVARPVTQPIEFRGAPNLPAEQFSNADAVNADGDTSNEAPAVVFSAPDLIIAGGQKLTIPIQARVRGRFPIRVWMFNAVVEPLDGAPPLTEQVEFVPHGTFGRPTFTSSRSLANYGAAWLNPSIAGLRGDTQIGTLQVKLPPDLSPDAAYRVRFEHISASPNGLAVFPQQVQDGLLLGRSREASSFNDGIPDTWRLRYFGSVDNLLSHANADADGDGVSNWAEFKAGTNPVDVRSNIRVKALHKPTNNRGLVLRWPTAKGKTYAIEAASSITSREWTPVSPNVTGTGFDMQFNPADGGITEQFYRVRLVE